MTPDGFYQKIELAETDKNSEMLKFADRSHRLDCENNSVNGFVDKKEAVGQAIVKILNTQKGTLPIYSKDYGIDLDGLFGMDCGYVCAELERRITEALTRDKRITEVGEFEFKIGKKSVHASFEVNTVFGEITAEKEVSI